MSKKYRLYIIVFAVAIAAYLYYKHKAAPPTPLNDSLPEVPPPADSNGQIKRKGGKPARTRKY